MNDKLFPSDTTRIDSRPLLGFPGRERLGDWGRLRAGLIQHAGRHCLFLFAANILSAALTVLLLIRHVPSPILIGWSAAVAGIAGTITARRQVAARANRRTVPAGTMRGLWREGLALGLVWSCIGLLTNHRIDAADMFSLWMVVALLMTAVVVTLSSLLPITLPFLTLAGLSLSYFVLVSRGPLLAVTTLFFTALLALGSLIHARSLVRLRASELALSERDETVSLLLREFEDSGADWLWETDTAKRIVRASARFCKAVGVDQADVDGKPFLQLLAGESWESGDFAPGLRELAEKLKARDSFRDLLLPVTVGDEQRWWEIAASPRYDDRGAFIGFRGVSSDVTEARQSADKINRMARFDTLTGLPNRLMINENLSLAMADADRWGGRCAFMMIDLDRFKAVNDSLGHLIGDRLLSRVSDRLRQLATDNELVGRLGGDEFAVVVRDASDPKKLEDLAQRIISTLSRAYEVDQNTLYIGASVGVAIGPRDGRTAEMLMRSADLALYRTKDQGGGGYHQYEPQLHVEAEERRIHEIALRHAIEKGELHLDYQPVVNADDGMLTGFEALVRWRHPELGSVSPAKFIPLAEEARLIAPIGEWVLRTACEEAAKWPHMVRVAVNVSPEQLQNPNFVTIVASALSQSRLPAERLELEVTESVFMHEGTCAVQVLERILDLGVRLSLDDFGTGYSSLGYLSRTRFSTIKIDRSFVQGASEGAKEAIAIIRAVVALARSLGMATTAEGVETAREHEMVQELGCSKVQGYYFGRPLPAREAREIADRRGNQSQAA